MEARRWATFENRLSRLEQRPVLFVWGVCAVLAFPVLFVFGPGMIVSLIAFGTALTLVFVVQPLRRRPGIAIFMAPVLWFVLMSVVGLVARNLGIVAPG